MLTALCLRVCQAPDNESPPGCWQNGWGDRARYSSARKVQALAGTAPVPKESGNYRHAQRRSACLKPLRNALYQFAWQSVRLEPWAKAYYQHQRAQGKSHSVAVRALSNTWVRIVYAMWRTPTGYQRTTFEAAQGAHATRAA